MSSENIKKVYVLNLDKTRISIISGLFILSLGGAFLAGLKFNKNSAQVPVITASQFSGEDINSNEANPKKYDENILSLPEEDNQIFSSNSDDPFLIEPPSRNLSGEKKENPKSVSKSEVKIKKKSFSSAKNNKAENNSKNSEGIFYSVQIGAFAHEKDASGMVKDLKKKGIDARVDKGTLYYFVRTGKASKKESLDQVYQKLTHDMKLKAIIIQKKIS